MRNLPTFEFVNECLSQELHYKLRQSTVAAQNSLKGESSAWLCDEDHPHVDELFHQVVPYADCLYVKYCAVSVDTTQTTPSQLLLYEVGEVTHASPCLFIIPQ